MFSLIEEQRSLRQQILSQLIPPQIIIETPEEIQTWITQLKESAENEVSSTQKYLQDLSFIFQLKKKHPEQQQFIQHCIHLARFLLTFYHTDRFGVSLAIQNIGHQKIFFPTPEYQQQDKDKAMWKSFSEVICDALLHPNTLIFSLHICDLYQLEWSLFYESIKQSQIQELNLAVNNLSNLDLSSWSLFCESIKQPQIQELNLALNNLSDLDPSRWSLFCESIEQSRIQELNLTPTRDKKNLTY
jgi:hypothetical protein